jgi:hypothetical protein
MCPGNFWKWRRFPRVDRETFPAVGRLLELSFCFLASGHRDASSYDLFFLSCRSHTAFPTGGWSPEGF